MKITLNYNGDEIATSYLVGVTDGPDGEYLRQVAEELIEEAVDSCRSSCSVRAASRSLRSANCAWASVTVERSTSGRRMPRRASHPRVPRRYRSTAIGSARVARRTGTSTATVAR